MNYVPRFRPMIRNLRRRGFGDDCGANPCTWWDEVWLRDACRNYLTCSDPNNALLTIVNRGLVVGGAQVAGSTVGEALGTGVESAAQAVAVNPATGQMNWLAIGLIGIGLLLVVPRLVGGR